MNLQSQILGVELKAVKSDGIVWIKNNYEAIKLLLLNTCGDAPFNSINYYDHIGKNITDINTRNVQKFQLNSLAKSEWFCKFAVSDKQNRGHDSLSLFFDTYIRAAGGHSYMESVFVAIHCLRLFFSPYRISSLQNSDK